MNAIHRGGRSGPSSSWRSDGSHSASGASSSTAARRAVDRQADVAHERTILDLGQHPAGRIADLAHQLLDGQRDVGTSAFEVQNLDVFEAHEGSEDLGRVSDDVGASALLAHTSSLKHLRRVRGDPGHGRDPTRIR